MLTPYNKTLVTHFKLNEAISLIRILFFEHYKQTNTASISSSLQASNLQSKDKISNCFVI